MSPEQRIRLALGVSIEDNERAKQQSIVSTSHIDTTLEEHIYSLAFADDHLDVCDFVSLSASDVRMCCTNKGGRSEEHTSEL